MRLRAPLAVIALLLGLGCEGASPLRCGPGTSELGGECAVVDGGTIGPADGGRSDTGVTIVEPQTLLLEEYPSHRDVKVLPGSLSCLRLWVLGRDGRTEALVPLAEEARAEVDDPSVAMPAAWDDCRGRTTGDGAQSTVGIIGLREGSTRVRVVVDRDAQLSAYIGVTVEPYAIRVEPTLQPSLPIGRADMLSGAASVVGGTFRGTPTPSPSLFRFEIADPSLLEVVRDEALPHHGFGFLIRGLARGTTSLTVRYGPGSAQAAGPFSISITDPGTVVEINRIVAELEVNAIAPTGYCHRASATGTFHRDGEADYRAELTTGVAWQALDDGLMLVEDAPRALFCATRAGESRVRACLGTICRDETLAAFAGALVAIEVTPNPVTAQASYSGTGPFQQRLCVPTRVELVFDDGQRFDATTSVITRYDTFPTTGFSFLQDRDAAGLPRSQGGAPCFWLQSDDVCPTVTEADVDVFVEYATALPPRSIATRSGLTVHVTGIAGPDRCP